MGQEVGHTGQYEPWHVSLKPLIFLVWLRISWWLGGWWTIMGATPFPRETGGSGRGGLLGSGVGYQRTHSREGVVECRWGRQGREEPICQHWAYQTQPSQLCHISSQGRRTGGGNIDIAQGTRGGRPAEAGSGDEPESYTRGPGWVAQYGRRVPSCPASGWWFSTPWQNHWTAFKHTNAQAHSSQVLL